MLLHGVENPDIRYRTLLKPMKMIQKILSDPCQSFCGKPGLRIHCQGSSEDRRKQRKQNYFWWLFLRLLQIGGRAAVVPDGVWIIQALRRLEDMVEDQKLDTIISMPWGVFKPYAGVSTAILLSLKPTQVVLRCVVL